MRILDKALRGPNFMLAVVGIILIMVDPDIHMVDLDVGEMIYIFRISLLLSKCCGVKLVPYFISGKDKSGSPYWLL